MARHWLFASQTLAQEWFTKRRIRPLGGDPCLSAARKALGRQRRQQPQPLLLRHLTSLGHAGALCDITLVERRVGQRVPIGGPG